MADTLQAIDDNIELEDKKSRLQAWAKIFLWTFTLLVFFGAILIHLVHPQASPMRIAIEGMVLAVLFFVLHVTAVIAADRIGWGKVDPKGPKSLSDALRK